MKEKTGSKTTFLIFAPLLISLGAVTVSYWSSSHKIRESETLAKDRTNEKEKKIEREIALVNNDLIKVNADISSLKIGDASAQSSISTLKDSLRNYTTKEEFNSRANSLSTILKTDVMGLTAQQNDMNRRLSLLEGQWSFFLLSSFHAASIPITGISNGEKSPYIYNSNMYKN